MYGEVRTDKGRLGKDKKGQVKTDQVWTDLDRSIKNNWLFNPISAYKMFLFL